MSKKNTSILKSAIYKQIFTSLLRLKYLSIFLLTKAIAINYCTGKSHQTQFTSNT